MRRIIILDLEVSNSPDWCKHCYLEKDLHGSRGACLFGSKDHVYTKLGWEDHAALGLAIGCYWDSQKPFYQYFDGHTLRPLMLEWIQGNPLLVTFNGQHFDLPLMAACLPASSRPSMEDEQLRQQWQTLSADSYDILQEIWKADEKNRYQRGNGLGAIASANGYGTKALNGALAPALWHDGHYAEVINYCTDDVIKTKLLFEHILRGEPVLREAGAITLPKPMLT